MAPAQRRGSGGGGGAALMARRHVRFFARLELGMQPCSSVKSSVWPGPCGGTSCSSSTGRWGAILPPLPITRITVCCGWLSQWVWHTRTMAHTVPVY